MFTPLCVLFYHRADKGAAYEREILLDFSKPVVNEQMIEMFAAARTGGETKWKDQLADELHKPANRKIKRRRVITNSVDDIWSADLVNMQWSS